MDEHETDVLYTAADMTWCSTWILLVAQYLVDYQKTVFHTSNISTVNLLAHVRFALKYPEQRN